MSDNVEPALSPGQWEADLAAIEDGKLGEVLESYRDERHPLAAIALYGQPFGFTHDDLHMVRAQASARMTDAPEPSRDDPTWGYWNQQRRWRELADRIAALLPPG